MKSNLVMCKTKDGHNTFRIRKDKETLYLGNIKNYESDINSLLENFSDVRFDSKIFIFGLDTGEYIAQLGKSICDLNKIFIFEPNILIYEKYKEVFRNSNITLVYFDKDKIKEIFDENITTKNYINIYVAHFGSYEEIYKEEYESFIEFIDYYYNRSATFRSTSYGFKEIYLKNLLSNLEHINDSTPFDHYLNYNEGVPAIIISAGPSLDKNMEELIKFRDKLNNFFIIAGNRTLGPLIKNNIRPDLVISIDPQEITYKMIGEYLEEDIPLLFYEQTNGKLVNEYKGNKIFTTKGVFCSLEGLDYMINCYSGGSVAHTSVDIGVLLGCNPIILAGQDLAYTYDKDHAKVAKVPIDDFLEKSNEVVLKDVYGNDIRSSSILKIYKRNLENYIKAYSQVENKEFINVSYGAEIENTIHKELRDIFSCDKYSIEKKPLTKAASPNIDIKAIKQSLLDYIDGYIDRCGKNIEICQDLIQNPRNDEEARIIFGQVVGTIEELIKDKRSLFISAYLDTFLFEIKEKHFKIKAKEYSVLSSNLFYQCNVFTMYFKELRDLLKVIRVNCQE